MHSRIAICAALTMAAWLLAIPGSASAQSTPVSACASPGTITNAVVRYYLAIERRQFAAAYACLGPVPRASQTYQQFASGYARTVASHLVMADDEVPNGTRAAHVSIELRAVDRSAGGLTATTYAGLWVVRPNGLLAGARIRVMGRRPVGGIPPVDQRSIFARRGLAILSHRVVHVTGKGVSDDLYVTSGSGCASCHAQQLWIYQGGELVFQQEVDDAQIVPFGSHTGMYVWTDTPGSPGLDSCCPTKRTQETWVWTAAGFALRSQRVVTLTYNASHTVNPLVHDAAVIRAHGYIPVPRLYSNHVGYVKTRDGFGHTLYAWVGVCKGSGDGYCQKVFFFIGTRFVGTDSKLPEPEIDRIAARGVGTIAVTYANYLKNDPMCCPTGRPFTETYHWNGRRMVRSRPRRGRR